MVAAFIFFLFMLSIFFLPLRTALIFYEKDTGELEAYLPRETGSKFDLVFTHSIHHTDVTEKYSITANMQIEQYEIIFEQFGIGMPSNSGEGETFTYEDGVYHIKDLNNRFEEIKLRNGKTVSENRLGWEAHSGEYKMVWLNDYFAPGAMLTLRVEKMTLWDMMKGVKIDE